MNNEGQRTLVALRNISQMAVQLESHLTHGGNIEHAAWLHIDREKLEKAVEILDTLETAIQSEIQ